MTPFNVLPADTSDSARVAPSSPLHPAADTAATVASTDAAHIEAAPLSLLVTVW
jgi:hypothetical protein